ncbi:eukaryotic translation initiation factor 1A, X-chromosomal-like isoform X2 [Mesoplodon densirostris]|uniref:eukaryotic translation initiation factor 1A, X-chromosomal-like isoform X2 n=1 Tax=Mesoplodon densirostris TaxID=48708 RepID=UPI0028DB7449|nr:eukaryotic translation initiation factor 1A, X-chromosomal-like isoform X2 [Mesoplodon densirostris]
MPKNKGKGGKNRRRGKNENESEKRELVFKEDGQEYAQVIKMLGNGRLEAMCFDGVKRLCHIRGKLRKKVWINTSDIILVGLRDYQQKLMKQIPLVLAMMTKSSLMTLEMMMKTLMISKLNSKFLRTVLQFEFWSSPVKKNKTSFSYMNKLHECSLRHTDLFSLFYSIIFV